jgi:hypothetical protein
MTNISFLRMLNDFPGKFCVATQLEQIVNIETEINVYHPLETPDLSIRYQYNSDSALTDTANLMFKRLKKLVIALKKYNLLFNDSNDLIFKTCSRWMNQSNQRTNDCALKSESSKMTHS